MRKCIFAQMDFMEYLNSSWMGLLLILGVTVGAISEKFGALMQQKKRQKIAEEIIRRIDTVAFCTCKEVADIMERAAQGEFDGIFDNESNK